MIPLFLFIPTYGTIKTPSYIPDNGDIFFKALPYVINFLIVIALLLALLFLVWGGLSWVISGGDKQKVEGARKTITFAVIGLIVIFLSYAVIRFVGQTIFGDSQLVNLKFIPTHSAPTECQPTEPCYVVPPTPTPFCPPHIQCTH